MAGRIRRMTAVEVEHVLRRHGYTLVSQHGSHCKWRNNESRLQVIVPEHAGRQLPLGTLRNIFGNSGIPDSEWRD